MTRERLLTVTAAAVLVVAGFACAPEFPKAVFVYSRHPDFPRTDYLSGRLGVFQPTYARSYLVVAYRYLSGRPLNATEREQVRDFWKDRGTSDWDRTGTVWLDKWKQARARVSGTSPAWRGDLGANRHDAATNSFYLNCAEDAFRTAFYTLEARGSRFGFRSTAVQSWRNAQDAVFANCDGTKPVTPAAAATTLPAVIRADRDYQIAAAAFYAGQYDDAESAFRRIAADADSPWKWIAPYLVVRSMARTAQLDPSRSAPAIAEARRILADPKLTSIHGVTRVLLNRMLLAKHDEGYFHELARDLAGGANPRSFREELWDYTDAFDRLINYDPWLHAPAEGTKIDPAVFQQDDMSDWILTYQGQYAGALDHAVSRWRQTRSVPWLVAALSSADVRSRDVRDLIAAASSVAAGSPGFETVAYHRLRLEIDTGDKSRVRAELDQILPRLRSKSAVNLFRGLRMRTAPTLTDFLSYALREPVLRTVDAAYNAGEVPVKNEWTSEFMRAYWSRTEGKPLLDRDAVITLNEQLPLAMLAQAALSDNLPKYVERDVVIAAFTRALLLENPEHGVKLAAKLAAVGADQQSYLPAYRDARDPVERRFAGIFYLLHHPESRPYVVSGFSRLGRPGSIDPYRDNWWCPVDAFSPKGATVSGSAPPFLTGADRNQAAGEFATLAAAGGGPDYLIDHVMQYARAHRSDPRVPEAIHYALRSQRYGCPTAATPAKAEQAWRYMWRVYPRNPWTRKSNYPFESENLPQPGWR
jgi:hypothetical protein